VVLLASLAADSSTIPQNVQLPALGSPAIAGEQPWSELKPLLAARASADGPKPSRTLESVDLAGSGRVRRTVLVTSEPTGAQVHLGANTNPLCQTPCGIQVSEGTYSLRTTLAGYQDNQQSVQTAGADRELRATLTPIRGNVIVETPSPGSVAINGIKGAAQSPVELALLPGVYRIGVDFGSGMQERVITIKPATHLRLQIHP
jgi:hypothetical protein